MAHFYASVPDEIANMTHAEAVDAFVSRAFAPMSAIEGMTVAHLNAHPVPGTWSIKEIVVHLLDTDLIACYRMKRIIAEDRPRIDVYDENAFAARLFYGQQDAAIAVTTFMNNRMNMGVLLRSLRDDAFDRVAIHPEIGELPLGRLVRLYVHHVDHHLAFVRRKRAMLTAPQ